MKYWFLLFALLCGSAYGQSCTTTLSAGANVGTSISGATAGDTICLNDGNYSGFTLNGVSKSPRVTVRAVNSRSASFTSGVTFSGNTNGITIDGVNFNSTIEIFGQNTREITLQDFNSLGEINIYSIQTSPTNILISDFSQLDRTLAHCNPACINLEKGSYTRTTPIATISRAIIDGGCADGLRFDTPAILEYSYIANKQVNNCSGDPHVDALQFYGGPFSGSIIRGNYWYCNVQVIAAYDGVDGVLIEDNILDPGASGCGGAGITERRPAQIEWYTDTDSIIRHNTVVNRGGGLGSIELSTKNTCGSGTVIENNIAASLSLPCTPSVNRNNLLASGASGSNISGSPTFVGGTYPSTWAGFALASGSAGENAATDGSDVGSAYFGEEVVRPNPPTDIVVTHNWMN